MDIYPGGHEFARQRLSSEAVQLLNCITGFTRAARQKMACRNCNSLDDAVLNMASSLQQVQSAITADALLTSAAKDVGEVNPETILEYAGMHLESIRQIATAAITCSQALVDCPGLQPDGNCGVPPAGLPRAQI